MAGNRSASFAPKRERESSDGWRRSLVVPCFGFPFVLFFFRCAQKRKGICTSEEEEEEGLLGWVACFAQEIRAPLFAASFFLFPTALSLGCKRKEDSLFSCVTREKVFLFRCGIRRIQTKTLLKSGRIPFRESKQRRNASSDSCVNGSLPPPFFKHGLVSPTMVAAAAVRGRVAWLERRGTMQGEYSDVLLTSFPTQKTMLNESYRMFLDSRKSSLRNNAVSMSKTLFCMEIRHPQGRITALFLLLPPR